MQLPLEAFETMVSEAIDAIPERYAKHVQNVAFIVDDDPSKEQRTKLQLRSDQTLFGLYEGIPLPARHGVTGNLLPDKITIFKHPIEQHYDSPGAIRDQVHKTVWHEVAHYFGLDHDRIYALEREAHKLLLAE